MRRHIAFKYFLGSVLLTLIIVVLTQNLMSDEIYSDFFLGKFSTDELTKLLKVRNQFLWLNYIITPIILLVKYSFLVFCFWLGSLFRGENRKIKDFFKIVILSEFVFIMFGFIKTGLLYYYNFQQLSKINEFQPFTLYSILNVNYIPVYFHYPLALISIQEVIYWIALALLLKPLISSNFWNRLGFVAKTYGVGLLIWVSIVVFATLNFTT